MSTDIVDLDQLMETLAKASEDPSGVTVGEFAKAVQSLQAELKMLETEVDRLTGTVNSAFGEEPGADASDDQAAGSMTVAGDTVEEPATAEA